MALAIRTDVPVGKPPPSPRRHIYFALDAETIGLGRAYAGHRGQPFAAWLSKAIRDRCSREAYVRSWGKDISEEVRREVNERLERQGYRGLLPYTPSGPLQTVSTVLSERVMRRVAVNARHAGLSDADWMARSVWYYVQMEEHLMAQERHRARFRRWWDAKYPESAR